MTCKKLVSIILSVCIMLSLSVSAFAYGGKGFNDISSNEYYYKDIMALANSGVINGYEDGSFKPQAGVTHAESLKMILGLAGINYIGCDTSNSKYWYRDIKAYCESKNIVKNKTNYDKKVSRRVICEYIIDTLNLKKNNLNNKNIFTDTKSRDEKAIANTMYSLGLIAGIPNGDGTVRFGGNDSVIRGDLCILLKRLDSKILNNSGTGEINKPSGPIADNPSNNYVVYWRNAIKSKTGEYTCPVVTFDYGTPISYLDEYMEYIYGFLNEAFRIYPIEESMYNDFNINCSYYEQGGCVSSATFKLIVQDESNNNQQNIIDRCKYCYSQCDSLLMKFREQGKITNNTSNREKAKLFYEYIDKKFEYDLSCNNDDAYDLLTNNQGICSGYTALFNNLCREEGMEVESVRGLSDGESHIWSRINTPNGWRYCDVTFGDPVPNRINYSDLGWFWLTEQEFYSNNKHTA